uniref:Centromere protein P n=1 Tax=Neolamprologus brichardi TaxID=32507 RepID=A0A3Q4HHC8_NEOBR
MSDDNTEEVMVLESEIERLQAEVESLQHQKQEINKDITFHYSQQMENRQEAGKEMVMSRLKEELEELEEDVKLQTEINGITLNSCTTKTLQNSGRKLVQQLSLSGNCSELVFQVEFQLSEIKQDSERSKRTIGDLNVVLDSSDLQNFSSFLSRVEESRDLLLFFRTLRTFSDRCDDRSRTFQQFQDKYPSVVTLPGGPRSEVMTVNHPKLPGCMLFIHWSVDVSREGIVMPKINLLTKIPERGELVILSSAFESLLRILGPEAALESIIQAVSLSQET